MDNKLQALRHRFEEDVAKIDTSFWASGNMADSFRNASYPLLRYIIERENEFQERINGLSRNGDE